MNLPNPIPCSRGIAEWDGSLEVLQQSILKLLTPEILESAVEEIIIVGDDFIELAVFYDPYLQLYISKADELVAFEPTNYPFAYYTHNPHEQVKIIEKSSYVGLMFSPSGN